MNVANIDNLGNVHPDTFWWHYSLGNVKERPFGEIWHDLSDPIMAGLKARPRQVKGRCGACGHFAICGGNTRVRAMRIHGDPWAEDPACYLTDEEIGLVSRSTREGGAACARSGLAPSSPLPLRQPQRQIRQPSTPRNCAACHGSDRLGGTGPALLPENLGRLKPEHVAAVIRDGRAGTQMPGFGQALAPAEVMALAAYALTPLPQVPAWGEAEIRASRRQLADPARLPERPVFAADPLNLFVVVETGDHHITVLDGDRFEPITRFPTRFALHGGPKFSPDGRFVHLMSRDGWVTRYDLWGLTPVAEVRAGINSRNIAISDDGRVIAVANYLPHTLVMLDAATLEPLAVMTVDDAFHKKTSRVSAVYQAAPRKSFVVALKDLPEIWEVSYDPNPPRIFSGLVHNYEPGMEEGLAQSRSDSRFAGWTSSRSRSTTSSSIPPTTI